MPRGNLPFDHLPFPVRRDYRWSPHLIIVSAVETVCFTGETDCFSCETMLKQVISGQETDFS